MDSFREITAKELKVGDLLALPMGRTAEITWLSVGPRSTVYRADNGPKLRQPSDKAVLVMNLIATGRKHVDEDNGLVVETFWSGVHLDRPQTSGWLIGDADKPNNVRLADRLIEAINAQEAYLNPRVVKDIAGNTYVEARQLVFGKRLNADLKRLGF